MSSRNALKAHCSFELLESRRMLAGDLVADVDGIYPTDSVKLHGVSYFVANDSTHGRELWRSDGTVAGTQLVKDITPGGNGSNINQLQVAGDHLFFWINSGQTISLYSSDGSGGGTIKLAEFDRIAEPTYTTAVAGGQLFFMTIQHEDSTGNDSIGSTLWASDGTVDGTRAVKVYTRAESERASINTITAVGERIVFSLSYGELWASDGTAAGTIRLTPTDLRLDLAEDKIGTVDGVAIFVSGSEVWRSDGTLAGTYKTKEMQVPGESWVSGDSLHIVGGRAYFHLFRSSGPRGLWVSDGTSAGTFEVAQIPSSLYQAADSEINGNQWIFGAGFQDEGLGGELWVTDGTPGGSGMLKDINVGGGSSHPSDFVRIGNLVFFTADDGVHGRQVWRTDGTGAGTVMISDLDSSAFGATVDIENVNGKLAVTLTNAGAGGETQMFDPGAMLSPQGPVESSIRLDNGTLRITGTREDDSIKFYRMTDETRFAVSINGGAKRAFRFADVSRIIVYTFSGNDAIAVNERYGMFKARLFIWGGAGDDIVYTGSAVDRVYGEQGNDRIFSGRSNDTVLGGSGDDRLVAGTGADFVSGGFGTDQISGGGGSDVLFGQSVYDHFFKDRPQDGVVVEDDEVLMF